MKKYFFPSLKLTLVFIILCSVIYPLLIAGISRFAPGAGKGETVSLNGRIVGYANVGQKFSADKYFWGRPSAVDYNAAGSAGTNKGPSNPEYIQQVADRIDSFLLHNPGVERSAVPAEMITASGSGLDPDISPASAYIQVKRISAANGLDTGLLKQLVDRQVEKSLLGPSKVNVLRLNVALEEMKQAR